MISVLFVEDEALMLKASQAHLERTGIFSVTPAQSGIHALELLRESVFDAIVADYHMNGMDGIELLKKVRSVDPEIPFIIFTGKGREEVAVEAFDHGASFYVQKGGDPKAQFVELARKIRISVEKCRAEAALLESRELYRQFVEHSREGIALYGSDGEIPLSLSEDEQAIRILSKVKILECNNAFAIQNGLSSAVEMQGGMLESLLPGTRDEKLALIRQFIRSGYSLSDLECLDLRKDKPPLSTLNTLIGVIKNQHLVHTWVSRQDITEQKSANDALREAQIHDRSLIEASLDPLVTIGPDGKITDVNHATELVTGFGRDQLVGTDFSDYFTEPEAARGIYEQVFREGNVRDYPLELRHKNGRITHVLYHATVYRDEKGNVRGVFAAARDITERKQVADALARSEALHRSLFLASPDAMILADPGGIITQISPRAVVLFGLTYPEEAKGTSLLSWVADDDRSAGVERLKKFLDGEDLISTIYRLRRKNGSVFFADTRTAVLHDSRGEITGLISIVRDITDRKRAEDALHQMNRQLQLMGSITRHDIMNQLMALESYVLLAGEVADPSQSSLNEFIKKEGDIIRTIKTQIQFTRDYGNMGVKQPVWQNLNTCVNQACVALPVSEVVVSVDNHSVEVLADPLFSKVIYNLIDNSLRYGGRDLSRIMFSTRIHGDDLIVICEDDGVGIPDGDKEVIFERGFGNNTGLGLFLAREIVALTGMTLNETGTYGSGAEFVIRVPARSFRILNAD